MSLANSGDGRLISSHVFQRVFFYHYDVMTWVHFPHYWPLVNGIHRSPAVLLQRASYAVLQCLVSLNKLLNKQSILWSTEAHERFSIYLDQRFINMF